MRNAPQPESPELRTPTAEVPRPPRPSDRSRTSGRAVHTAYAPEVACDLPDTIPVSAGELGLVLAYLSDEIARILAGDDDGA